MEVEAITYRILNVDGMYCYIKHMRNVAASHTNYCRMHRMRLEACICTWIWCASSVFLIQRERANFNKTIPISLALQFRNAISPRIVAVCLLLLSFFFFFFFFLPVIHARIRLLLNITFISVPFDDTVYPQYFPLIFVSELCLKCVCTHRRSGFYSSILLCWLRVRTVLPNKTMMNENIDAM